MARPLAVEPGILRRMADELGANKELRGLAGNWAH
jgi:hypothetical protein